MALCSLEDSREKAVQLAKCRSVDGVVSTPDVACVYHMYCMQVVLQEDQSLEDGRAIAEELMVSLGVACDELLSGAYMDMILEGQLKDSKNK